MQTGNEQGEHPTQETKRRTTRIVRPSNLGPGRLLRLLRSRAVSSRPAENMMADIARNDNWFGSSDSALVWNPRPEGQLEVPVSVAASSQAQCLWRLVPRVNLIGAASPDRDDR